MKLAGKKAGSLIAAEDGMIDDEFDDFPEIKMSWNGCGFVLRHLRRRMKKKTADVDIKKAVLKRE